MYLAMGMTEEQYWDGDANLARMYRKADEIRFNRRNQEAWLQGMYIYEAILDASPVMQAFAKKGTKAHPYSEKPYAITNEQRKKRAKDVERENMEKAKRYMIGMMATVNKNENQK